MSLEMLCNHDLATVNPQTPIAEVAKLMQDKNIGCVVVTQDTATAYPAGIITDRDIAVKVVAAGKDVSHTQVAEVMTQDLLVLDKKQGIQEAIEAMQHKAVRRAPIVDHNQQVCGIASVDDLVVLIANEMHDLANLIDDQIKH